MDKTSQNNRIKEAGGWPHTASGFFCNQQPQLQTKRQNTYTKGVFHELALDAIWQKQAYWFTELPKIKSERKKSKTTIFETKMPEKTK